MKSCSTDLLHLRSWSANTMEIGLCCSWNKMSQDQTESWFPFYVYKAMSPLAQGVVLCFAEWISRLAPGRLTWLWCILSQAVSTWQCFTVLLALSCDNTWRHAAAEVKVFGSTFSAGPGKSSRGFVLHSCSLLLAQSQPSVWVTPHPFEV